MLISDSHRFLFVHVQKTGGSTIDNGLTAALGDVRRIPAANRHAPLDRLLQLEPGLADYWTAGFVRNPWARMVSWWRMMERFRDGAAEGIERYLDHLQRNRFVAGDHREAPRLRVVRHARARRPPAAAQAAGGVPQQRHEARGLHRSPGEPRGRPRSRSTTTSGWSGSALQERQHRPGPTGLPRPLHRDDPQAGGRAVRGRTCASTATSSDPASDARPIDVRRLLRGYAFRTAVRDPDGIRVSACPGRSRARSRRRRPPARIRQPGVRPSRSRRGQQTAALFETLIAAADAERARHPSSRSCC